MNKEHKKIEKLAYQVGTQGYSLMNDRAFCNCQKKKLEKTDSPWEAWNGCWEEYKEAYNSDPAKWLKAYIPLEDSKTITAESNIKKMIKENFVKDVEEMKGDSPFTGVSIRNTLRCYAREELKDKIQKSQKS